VADLKKGDRLTINLQKSPQYRSIHCDGAYGGVTGRAYISFTFYNERMTLPRTMTREVLKFDKETGAGELGPEEIGETLGGVMRQLEATIFMDVNAAREFYGWFGEKLLQLEESLGFPKKEWQGRKRPGGGNE